MRSIRGHFTNWQQRVAIAGFSSICGLSALSLVACNDVPEESSPLATDDAELASSTTTAPSRFSAVGLVGYATTPNPGYYPWSFTPMGVATLIGKRTLLVSLNWIWHFEEDYYGGPLVFSYGDNPFAAEHTIPIVDADLAPPNEKWEDFDGYFAGTGGLGVYYLKHDASELSPLDVAAVQKSQEGKIFHVPWLDLPKVGDPDITVGKVRLMATSGSGYQAMFERFNAFAKWYEATGGASGQYPPPPDELRLLKGIYAGTELAYGNRSPLLETHHEVLAKGLPGRGSVFRIDVWGDGSMGAPLLSKNARGHWHVYGLYNENFPGSNELPDTAQHALDFKAFGPETLAFLKSVQTHVDPCSKTHDTSQCDGYKLRICGTDQRTVRTLNCRWEVGDFGATCGQSSDGTPACLMPETP